MRPAQGYRNAEGKRLPGVTTILSLFGDKGGLVYAANQLGLDGKNIKDEWYGIAANIGTLAHDLFETHLKRSLGDECPDPDLVAYKPAEIEKAQQAAENAYTWYRQTSLEVVWTEHPLVSESLQVGGTPDALARDMDKRYVVADWKSGGVFGSALFQVAAYKILIEENHPNIKIEGFHIVRFAKDNGDFVHRYYSELDEQVAGFRKMRELYGLIKATDKRAK